MIYDAIFDLRISWFVSFTQNQSDQKIFEDVNDLHLLIFSKKNEVHSL